MHSSACAAVCASWFWIGLPHCLVRAPSSWCVLIHRPLNLPEQTRKKNADINYGKIAFLRKISPQKCGFLWNLSENSKKIEFRIKNVVTHFFVVFHNKMTLVNMARLFGAIVKATSTTEPHSFFFGSYFKQNRNIFKCNFTGFFIIKKLCVLTFLSSAILLEFFSKSLENDVKKNLD